LPPSFVHSKIAVSTAKIEPFPICDWTRIVQSLWLTSGRWPRYFPILALHGGFRYVQLSNVEFDRVTKIDDQMTTRPIPVPGSEFNDFLFAPIGEDRNGMTMSVLSGLVRSDVDPWEEAAKLAQLSGETATKELAALIGALPDIAASLPDSRMIAARLIALLPQPLGANGRPQQMPPHSAGEVMESHPWVIYVVFMCFVLGTQFLIAGHQLPPKSDSSEVKAGSSNSPTLPPPKSSK
jgi:hypothetical protein